MTTRGQALSLSRGIGLLPKDWLPTHALLAPGGLIASPQPISPRRIIFSLISLREVSIFIEDHSIRSNEGSISAEENSGITK